MPSNDLARYRWVAVLDGKADGKQCTSGWKGELTRHISAATITNSYRRVQQKMSQHNEEAKGDEAQPRHAGVWVRVAANLLDLVIMGVPLLLLFSLVFDFDTSGEAAASFGDIYSIEFLLNAAILAAITVLLWVNWDGRTPGKKLVKVRIVSFPDYGGLSYGTAALRSVLSLTGALTLGLLYLVMAVMIGVRKDNRGFHDLLSGTCVVHDR